MKDYGQVALILKFYKPILNNLLEIFNDIDAYKILVIVLIRSIYGNVTLKDLAFYYQNSFLSEKFPNVSLSEKTVSELFDSLGRRYGLIREYMKNRVEEITDDSEIIIDGMLKTNNSEVNAFSEFSRKGRIKQSKDINIIYAFNHKNNEPLISKVYPGNMLDSSTFIDFLNNFDLNKGILMGDKGFLSKENYEALTNKTGLKFMFPIKRSSKEIIDYDLLNFDNLVAYYNEQILYKKVQAGENLFYYSFKNAGDESLEREGYLKYLTKRGDFDIDELRKKEQKFGTIVFKSNENLEPFDVYKIYEKRWNIEMMFRFYKDILEFKTTNVHSTYSVITQEFINYLSIFVSLKVKNFLIEKDLLSKYSYKRIIKFLDKYKIVRFDEEKDWQTTKVLKYIEEIVAKLELDFDV